jgi:hypothetical protein
MVLVMVESQPYWLVTVSETVYVRVVVSLLSRMWLGIES